MLSDSQIVAAHHKLSRMIDQLLQQNKIPMSVIKILFLGKNLKPQERATLMKLRHCFKIEKGDNSPADHEEELVRFKKMFDKYKDVILDREQVKVIEVELSQLSGLFQELNVRKNQS